jgi:hypothetical protein
MKMAVMLRAALPSVAVMTAGWAQAQPPQTGMGYAPGRTLDQLSWTALP